MVFRGNEQVRKNWTQIFAGVPDIRIDTLRTAAAGDEAWVEWEMKGTRRDGAAHDVGTTTRGGHRVQQAAQPDADRQVHGAIVAPAFRLTALARFLL